MTTQNTQTPTGDGKADEDKNKDDQNKGTGGAGGEGGAGDQKKPEEKENPLATDIGKAIEKARQQERSKLYPELETLKGSNKALEARLQEQAALIAKLQEEGEGEGEGDQGKGKKGVPGMSAADLEAIISRAVKVSEDKFKSDLDAAQKRISELEGGIKTRDLDAYRNRLISENQDTIIPELVQGQTQDDLDQALVVAKQAFARLQERLNNGKGNGDGPATQRQLPLPQSTQRQLPGGQGSVDVRTMSNEEYSKHRSDLLKAAGAEARKSLGS